MYEFINNCFQLFLLYKLPNTLAMLYKLCFMEQCEYEIKSYFLFFNNLWMPL